MHHEYFTFINRRHSARKQLNLLLIDSKGNEAERLDGCVITATSSQRRLMLYIHQTFIRTFI